MSCPRCQGQLLRDGKEKACLQCGHVVYPFIPMDRPKGERPEKKWALPRHKGY